MSGTSMKVGLANVRDMEGKGRIVARNTWRYRTTDGIEHVRLHGTDIVEFLPKGRVRLNSGGWKTVTTKDRIDSFSGYRIFSRKGTWLVCEPGQWDKAVPFFDGMILPDALKMPPAKAERLLAKEEKLKARIKAVVAKKIVSGKAVPQPNNGDCLFCQIERSQHIERLETGNYDSPRPDVGGDHIAAHIREGYIHGSLILNAYLDAGYKPFRWQWDSERVERGDTSALRDMRRIVTRFLKRRMGLA